jgi:hypothetical protein
MEVVFAGSSQREYLSLLEWFRNGRYEDLADEVLDAAERDKARG